MASAGPPMDPAAAAAAAEAAQAAQLQFTIEAWTLLGVALLVTMVRTFARLKAVGVRGLQPDDYLVWVGAICYAIETGLAYSVGAIARGLANNGMTDEQRVALPKDSEEYHLRVIGSQIQLGGWSTYSVLLWSLKASLLVFYMRLTVGMPRSYRIRIYVGFAFLIISWIVIVANLMLACRPFHNYWQINPNPGNVCQPAMSNQIIWMYFSMNVSTDLYLVSIPLPMLWASSLKPAKKVGLCILFSGGLLVIASATLRCVLLVADPVNGAQLAGSWAVRESFVAVITTNIPATFPLIKGWVSPILGSLMSTVKSSQKLTEGTPRDIRTFGGGGATASWRGRGPPTANPITNITFSESEERMVGEYKMQDIKTWSESTDSNNNSMKIRRHVEVNVVRDDEESQVQHPHNGHSAFVSGPRRTSFHAGHQV